MPIGIAGVFSVVIPTAKIFFAGLPHRSSTAESYLFTCFPGAIDFYY